MLTINQKINYALSSMLRSFEIPICPYCGGKSFHFKKSKYLFTKLLECSICHLFYRFPLERLSSNRKFYQKKYTEKDGVTSVTPSDIQLNELLRNNFNTGNKNAGRYIYLFQKIFPDKTPDSIKIIDYGCSWGYISYQLSAFGYDVQGFEISKSRAKYGEEKLHIDIETEESRLRKNNNIFFSSHVIEHHPCIKNMIDFGKSLIQKNGYFIAFSPNGCPEREIVDKNYHNYWGKVHPNFLNAEFYKYVFSQSSYIISSSIFDEFDLDILDSGKQYIGDLTSPELCVVAKIS